MKKLLALLLALTMMLTMLAACKGNDEPQETQGSQSTNKPSNQPEDDEEEYDITELLPVDLNYQNQEVTLCVRGDTVQQWEIGLREDDAQPLTLELYDRTSRTEERIGVSLAIDVVETWDKYNDAVAKIRNSIQYQEHKWDIVVGLSWRIPQLASEGLYYNLNNFDYFDSSNVWWSQSLAKELTVNERMFMATGDLSIDYMESAHAVFFNQSLAKAMEMDYNTFYKTVSEGKWTFDELYNLSKDAYVDLNGNTKRDSSDQYGLLIKSTMLQAFYTAAGCNMIPNDGESRPEFNVNTEYLEQVWTKVQKLVIASSTVEEATNSIGISSFSGYFREGKALFAISMLETLKRNTDMTDGFGVLPMPKYDEAQTSYYTQLHSCELWSIPVDANDPDMSAAVMSSMGYDSHEVVLAPHIEKLLKTRYVKDSASGYMIDTIYYNIYMNFDSIYNEVLMPGPNFSDKTQMPMFVLGALLSGSYGSAAAWWTSNQTGLKAELEQILEGFYN